MDIILEEQWQETYESSTILREFNKQLILEGQYYMGQRIKLWNEDGISHV